MILGCDQISKVKREKGKAIIVKDFGKLVNESLSGYGHIIPADVLINFVEDIISRDWDLKIEDIQVFCYQVKNGYFGSPYGKLDIGTLRDWYAQYLKMRDEDFANYHLEKKETDPYERINRYNPDDNKGDKSLNQLLKEKNQEINKLKKNNL